MKGKIGFKMRGKIVTSGDFKLIFILLGLAVAYNLFFLRSEVIFSIPDLNDNVLHFTAIARTVEALNNWQDITDHWLANFATGYPLFHYYQHLPHVATALIYWLLRWLTGLTTVFNWIQYLLLSLFPLSIYLSMRKLGFERLTAALAGLVSPLIATNGLYGLEYGSYIWRGYGMYTQLWGMILLPLALAYTYIAIRDGKGFLKAVLLLSATLLAHLVLGYIAALSAILFTFIKWDREEVCPRLKRLIITGFFTAAATSYFLAPFVLDSAYMNRSVWELPWKYNSYGYQEVLSNLLTGKLLDFGRLPVLTLLAAVGLAVCLWRREEKHKLVIGIFVIWLLLYFGQPTWGVLLSLLPMSQDLHFHRLIAGVHLATIFMAGIGLAMLWSLLLRRKGILWIVLAAGISALILLPAYRERQAFLSDNARWMQANQSAFASEQKDLDGLLTKLKSLPPGRVYSGLAANWGSQYKIGDVPVYAILPASGFDSLGYLYHALTLNADVQVLFDEKNPYHYNLFNVLYVVAPSDRPFPDFLQKVQDFGRHRLYRVATSGYFELVDSDVTLTGSKRDWYNGVSRWLVSGLIEIKQYPAISFGKVKGGAPATAALNNVDFKSLDLGGTGNVQRGQIVAEGVGFNTYRAEVVVNRESYLLLKVTYHPNWQGYLDGEKTGLVMLSPSFIGMKVGPGAHQVKLVYAPGPARRLFLFFGILSLIFLGLIERKRRWLTAIHTRLNVLRMTVVVQRAAGRIVKRLAVSPGISEWVSSNLYFIGGIFLSAILAGLPLFQFQMTSGHDAFAYLPRVVEFYQGLASGQLFPRWAPDLGAGYGQPLFNFTPPLFNYLASFFHFLGFNFVHSMDLALFVLLSLSGLAMYLFTREFFGRYGALAASIAYMFAPYVLVDIYVRHAFSEFSAFPFMPLVLWSIYRFSRDGSFNFFGLGSISTALLLLCSNHVSLIIMPVFSLYIIFLSVQKRSFTCLLKGAACLAVGLMLSAFFWLPGLLEKDFVKIALTTEGYLNYNNHFLYLHQLIYSPWGYGLSVAGPQDGMSFQIGVIHLLLLAVSIVALVRRKALHPEAKSHLKFFILILILAVFFTTSESIFIWERVPLLQYLQFPWRFLVVPAVIVSFACGFSFLLIEKANLKRQRLLFWLVVIGLFLVNFPHARPEKFYDVQDADFTPQQIAQRAVAVTASGEYEPVWVKVRPQQPPKEKLSVLEGQARMLNQALSPARYVFMVEAGSNSRLRVNTFYYPGWKIWVDGQEVQPDYRNESGLMDFNTGQGFHQIVVAFTDTPVRTWANRLTLLGLVILILIPALFSRAIFRRTRLLKP